MQPEALQEAHAWLDRAVHDLEVAALCLHAARTLPDVAAYHSQQAAEKGLKAFLAAHDLEIPRTHQLGPLVARCQTIAPDVVQLLNAAETLTPYAVRFRYPPGPLEPPLPEALEALQLATEVVAFVRRRLPLGGMS